MGLRYDLQPNEYEKYNKFAMYDIAKQVVVVPSASSLNFVVPTFPQAQVPVLTASQAGWPANNRSLINTSHDGFSPRFGFAWRPRGKDNTVVRGGMVFIATMRSLGWVTALLGSIFGSAKRYGVVGGGWTATPTIAFPNPFTGFGSATTLDPTTIMYSTVNPNLKPPVVQEYTLTVERQLRGWGMRGTYFGDHETGLIYGSDYNQPPPSNQPFAQSRRPISERL